MRITEIKLPLSHLPGDLEKEIISYLRIIPEDLISFEIVKRSVDARKKDNIFLVYSVDVQVKGEDYLLKKNRKRKQIRQTPDTKYRYEINVPEGLFGSEVERPVVVGAGPCGYFAALLLAQMGCRPLLIERGLEIKKRTVETFSFWKGNRPLNVESNVQFGEGGAGTFSDGKLYSQISDPKHYGRKVLEELVLSGANPDILIDHHPHIGTFKLATVVRGLRSRIKELGGDIYFQTRMDELILESNASCLKGVKPFEVVGLKLANGKIIHTKNIVLALGHSARDTFTMLQDVGIHLEAKPFAVGLRIEHPQPLIDKARWGEMVGHPRLGHAEYKLVYHANNGRTVYSFCMCPGGLVIGSSSEKNCVVTNGMSQHSRNERNANTALVVNLKPDDWRKYGRWEGDPLAGIFLQRKLEKNAYNLGGGNYFAPVQRLEDFLAGKPSKALGDVKPSYLPGVQLTDLNRLLPDYIAESLKESLFYFDSCIPGYNKPDAIITGIETRTSSPVRISRDTSLESLNVKGLFPAGEGAGYAGGILSAAIDGIRVAESLINQALCD